MRVLSAGTVGEAVRAFEHEQPWCRRIFVLTLRTDTLSFAQSRQLAWLLQQSCLEAGYELDGPALAATPELSAFTRGECESFLETALTLIGTLGGPHLAQPAPARAVA